MLGKGPLAQAMRATMAIPGVFTPVNYENWLLVDGGALNNIPADVVREMGADVVIAVDVSADVPAVPRKPGDDSLLILLSRTLDAMMKAGARLGRRSGRDHRSGT